MLKFKFFLLFSSISALALSQNVGIGTTIPNASAQLHIYSTSKGILIPQVSLDSLKDVTSILSPAHGLMVFNTTQPGVRNDMALGYYYYNNNTAHSWVRFSDNLNDNPFVFGGTLGIKLRDTADGVEIQDNYLGASNNWTPKVKILKQLDSALLNSKNNMNSLVLTAVNRKIATGWELRQKNSIIFENGYYSTGSSSGVIEQVAAISGYTENPGTTHPSDNRYNGLAFYTFATPQNTSVSGTPTISMLRHNVGIGTYVTDINDVTDGRLQVTGFSNGDQLSLRHPSSINLKWGMYVSNIDSSLNFYSNGSLRSNIDRVTGVYTALSDRNMKKKLAPLTPVLDAVMKLPAYTYQYLDGEPGGRRSIGFMAQDVQPYFPELVYQRYDREITKPVLTMDYSGFGIIAIKAIQEQQQQVESLKNENVEMKSLILLLQKRIEQLEKK